MTVEQSFLNSSSVTSKAISWRPKDAGMYTNIHCILKPKDLYELRKLDHKIVWYAL
jgi:hypothetical protein